MPHHQPACHHCAAPLDVPSFAPVEATCLACDRKQEVSLPTHGGVRRAELGIKALFTRGSWVDALERRDDERFVIADRCGRCEGPAVVPADTSLGAECTHCHTAQGWRVGEHVIDALPASKISGQTWGGGMSLRFEPSLVEASVDAPSPCLACGAQLAPFRGEGRCDHCGRSFHALLASGRRFLVGFHLVGDDEGRHVDGWVPIGEAVAHYAARRELVSRSSKSTIAAMGMWLVVGPIALFTIFGCGCLTMFFGSTMVPPEHAMMVPSLAIAIFALGALGLCALFGALLWSRISKHRKDRAALTDGLSPIGVRGLEADVRAAKG